MNHLLALPEAYPFSARMAEHLLLQLVIPPIALAAFSRFRWEGGWLARTPVLAWFIGLTSMWAWHDPALCNAAARSPWLYAAQLASAFVAGTVFWWPVVGPGARNRLPPLVGVAYLFTACLGCTVLGIVIAFAPAGLYVVSALPGTFNDWQFASPDDQRIGGLLMWVPGCLIYIAGILALMARWYRQDEIPSPRGI